MELIEREQQLKKLTDAWNQSRAGKGSIALVSGEAGVGKTSLIERFVAGQGRLARVLWGACDDLYSPQPLGPFLEIALQSQSELLQLVESGTDRLTFSTKFFIHLQKNPTPTIIVLEDLHWADEATLDVVKYLGRRIQLTKTLLILSYRDDEINSQHPLYFLLGDFPPHLSIRIPVPPFSESAVQLLAQRAGRHLEDLYTATGGNPFFVSEIIAAETDGIPASVRDAVLARVTRLSPAAKNVIELAALIPGTAELWLIEEILHPAPDIVDECVEHGTLYAKENSLAFRHELARQAVEDSIPIGRRREAHTKILRALLTREVDLSSHAQLVHHAVRAGDEEAALRYAPAAARQASALGAHREAASLYKTSLASSHRLSAETQAELFEGLSFENYLIDNVKEAIRTREQAILIWERLERYERAGDCKRWLSRLQWSLGNGKEAEKYADQAIEILLKQPPGPALAMAFSNKSQLHMLAWEEELAVEWGNRAMELAEELQATEIFVHALTNVGSIETLQDAQRGLEKIKQALQIARENDLHDHAARCYANLTSHCIRIRQYPEGKYWMDQALEYTSARDLDYYTVYLLGWQAQMSFDIGRWTEAEKQALEAIRLSRNVTITPFPALIALGHLKVRQGDPEAAALLERVHSVAVSSGEIQRIGPLAAARAEAAWWQDNSDQMIAEASPAYELALSRNDPWTFGSIAYWMWRAGKDDVSLDKLPQPYALMIKREWQAAADAWAQIGCPFEQALALAEGDDHARREALAIFERLGAKPAASDLRQKLQIGEGNDIQGQDRTGRQAASDNLTSRELEVLRLIGDGLSNPAIAEKLTISVGTVKAHTANIYSKLGANNRVQALTLARGLRLL